MGDHRPVESPPAGAYHGHAGAMLAVLSVGMAASVASRLVLSPLLPTIIADLSVSRFAAGLALSAMWALFALGQFPSGRLSDELTRKTVIVAGLAVLSVGCVVLAAAPGYAAFVVGAGLLGVGGGLFPTAGYALVSDLFERRRGTAFGIYSGSLNVGGVVAPGLAVVALAAAGWRASFVPLVAVVVAVTVAIHRLSAEPYDLSRADVAARETAGRLLGAPRFRRVLVAFVLFSVVWQGTTSFLPAFLRAEKGFSPGLANAAFALLFVVGAASNPLASALGDRYGHLRLATLAAAVAAAGLVAVTVSETTVAVAAGIVVFAVGLESFWPLSTAHVMDRFPAESRGGDLGAVRSTFVLLGSVGPAYVGYVAGAIDYGAAFAGFAACLLASAAVLAWSVGSSPGR